MAGISLTLLARCRWICIWVWIKYSYFRISCSVSVFWWFLLEVSLHVLVKKCKVFCDWKFCQCTCFETVCQEQLCLGSILRTPKWKWINVFQRGLFIFGLSETQFTKFAVICMYIHYFAQQYEQLFWILLNCVPTNLSALLFGTKAATKWFTR
jgi:hypothetical protein